MPEMHLKQSQFTCSAFGPFTKNDMIRLKEIFKILQKEQLLIKF